VWAYAVTPLHSYDEALALRHCGSSTASRCDAVRSSRTNPGSPIQLILWADRNVVGEIYARHGERRVRVLHRLDTKLGDGQAIETRLSPRKIRRSFYQYHARWQRKKKRRRVTTSVSDEKQMDTFTSMNQCLAPRSKKLKALRALATIRSPPPARCLEARRRAGAHSAVLTATHPPRRQHHAYLTTVSALTQRWIDLAMRCAGDGL